MSAPTAKNERISGAFALDKSNFLSCSSPCCVGLVMRFFHWKMWESQQKQPLMCWQKISSSLRYSQSCRTPSGINSLPCPLGRNTEEQQQVLGSISRENHSRGLRTQRIPNTFCCPGLRRSNMSWTQARYKVELQILYQSGRRNKVYLASWLHKPQVLRTTEQASFR